MQRAASLLLLPLVVLASGCLSQTGGPGIIIESFTPEFTEVYPGEPVSLEVMVRNTGSVDSEKGSVNILGLEDWIWRGGSCGYSAPLLGSQEVYGTGGESLFCPPMVYEAPEVPKGLPIKYTPTARLSYDYGSSTIKSLTLTSQAESKRPSLSLLSRPVSSSVSPVLIGVSTEESVRVFSSAVEIPITITLSNTGGGVVCLQDYHSCDDERKRNRIALKVWLGEDNLDSCNNEISLYRGETNSFVCRAEISDIPPAGILQKTIRVEAEYGYFTDALTEVTVRHRE